MTALLPLAPASAARSISLSPAERVALPREASLPSDAERVIDRLSLRGEELPGEGDLLAGMRESGRDEILGDERGAVAPDGTASIAVRERARDAAVTGLPLFARPSLNR